MKKEKKRKQDHYWQMCWLLCKIMAYIYGNTTSVAIVNIQGKHSLGFLKSIACHSTMVPPQILM
jgi:hypothetical protein